MDALFLHIWVLHIGDGDKMKAIQMVMGLDCIWQVVRDGTQGQTSLQQKARSAEKNKDLRFYNP